ncbi:hypothetical protein AGLY_011431 [Aphis glycines]|uniref:Uncharacterized protein n=1 Tax=Aphis glycines TaxID=307491 RepID=A0A6G0TDL5_APHGL|nr:hypothetical protein AGLY_011431 [Aphis glycines]
MECINNVKNSLCHEPLKTIVMQLHCYQWDENMDPIKKKKIVTNGSFLWQSEYPWFIIEVKSKKFLTVSKKIRKIRKNSDGEMGIFTQHQFSTKSIFLNCCNSKTNHFKFSKYFGFLCYYRQLKFLILQIIVLLVIQISIEKTRSVIMIFENFTSYLDWHFPLHNLIFKTFHLFLVTEDQLSFIIKFKQFNSTKQVLSDLEDNLHIIHQSRQSARNTRCKYLCSVLTLKHRVGNTYD